MNISKAIIIASTLLCFTLLVHVQSTRAKEQTASSITKTKQVKKQLEDPNIAIIGIGIKVIQKASIDMIRRIK